ncbi:MAG: RNA polymerase sigma factor [Planctomycetes bacterium]|nr:RNA polymerase sigma factor [Planctomycetota bacterium]
MADGNVAPGVARPETPLAELPGRIYGWAYRLLQNHHDAQDAVQDVLVSSLTHAVPAGEGQRVAWLRRVTINRCIDRLRARRAGITVYAADPADATPARTAAAGDRVAGCTATAAGAAEAAERRERIATALTVLSAAQRAVLVAKVYDAETFEEIARAQGISAGSAKTHYVRALRKLRERLAAESGGDR